MGAALGAARGRLFTRVKRGEAPGTGLSFQEFLAASFLQECSEVRVQGCFELLVLCSSFFQGEARGGLCPYPPRWTIVAPEYHFGGLVWSLGGNCRKVRR